MNHECEEMDIYADSSRQDALVKKIHIIMLVKLFKTSLYRHVVFYVSQTMKCR